ncbi:MAG: excinuclease ABC subunit UvrC, partial [Deltaproteobacteria bacterium]|nr:excinuclease ABC subunit UvrC [Deltaproteobacteria bacterium]
VELNPETLRQVIPQGPGAYLFKDRSGRVIYVGKAKNLRKRVLSYFRPRDDLPNKTALMMKKAAGLDYIITSTENEAFILESNLIRKHMPRYNIVLRDDKRYPLLRFDLTEPYPRLSIARKIHKDGAFYFGPFSSSHSVRSTLKLIDRVFRLRKCKTKGLPKRSRPCLNYQMDLCLGPCTYPIPEPEYGEIVQQVRLFLEGRNRELMHRLKKDMSESSERLDFEAAAGIRDQIRAIEKTVERQHVVSQRMEDLDVIGLARKGDLFQSAILFVRRGALVGSRSFLLRDPWGSAGDVMEAFLKQYYLREAFMPEKILISEPIEEAAAIMEWLREMKKNSLPPPAGRPGRHKRGAAVTIHRPLRGEKQRLVHMAVENAKNLLKGHLERHGEDLLIRVQRALKLKKVPRFIEGFDISNFRGDTAVGTIVSFVDGAPHGPGCRNYKIKAVEGIDDYGMMAELAGRRAAKGHMPDLFLVDGGKGHLSVVKKVLDQAFGAHSALIEEPAPGQADSDIPEVISIAKPDERRQEKSDKIYIPGRKNPITLRPDDPVLHLMMRVRDEAHGRAVSYHRRLRRKKLTESELDFIPGIGMKRRKILLQHFKNIDAIAKASPDALAGAPGIDRYLAKSIFTFFEQRGQKKGKK